MKTARVRFVRVLLGLGMVFCGLIRPGLCGQEGARKPAYALYAIASGDNSLVSQEDLRALATQFSFVYGKFSREQMDGMREINPKFRVLSYINTWNFSGSSMQPYAESRKRDLEHYLVGFLARDIGKDDRRIELKAFFDDYPPRLRPSTIKGNFSSTERAKPAESNYVTWLRIDDELMRIEEFDADTATVAVTRGFDGSKAVAHGKGDAVCHPTYNSKGVPGDSREEFENRGGFLAYIADPAATLRWDRVRDMTLETIRSGYDGVWIDCLGSISFGAVDVFAKSVNSKKTHNRTDEAVMEGWDEASHYRRVWNFRKNRPYDYNDHREYCEAGLARAYRELEKELGYVPMICANNIGPGYYPKMGSRKRYMMSTQVKPRPLDAYCMEGFVAGIGTEEFERFLRDRKVRPAPTLQDLEGWQVQVGILMDAYQDGLCAAPMMTQAGWKTQLFEAYDDAQREPYELYAYASFLLAVEKDAPARLGRPAFSGMGRERRVKIYPHYYWPLGAPSESKKELEAYRVPGRVSYWRKFSKGLVIVNPSENVDRAIAIDPPLFDPATGRKVRSVDLAPKNGRILLESM